jgi:hypothetical protein
MRTVSHLRRRPWMIKKMSEEVFGEWVKLLIQAKLFGLDTLSKKLAKQFAEEIEEARYGGMQWVKERVKERSAE